MTQQELVPVGEGALLGIRVNLPGAPVLMLAGKEGFVGCGYFDVAVADKVGHALAVVTGVSTFEDMLSAPVQAVSRRAAALGIRSGMTGADAGALLTAARSEQDARD